MEYLQALLIGLGYDVRTAPDGHAAEVFTAIWNPQIILLDLVRPGSDAMELLRRFRARHPVTPVIVLSGHATVAKTVEALSAGAFSLLEKPVDPERLLALLEKAASRRESAAKAQTPESLGQMQSRSAAMRHLFAMIRTAAPTDVNVLIIGENGTGKELVATSLHELSARRLGKFVKMNCAAIPADLLEAELFGSRRGAYTGAVSDRKGLFEMAHRGSILLDEIAEMSPALQVKLLRVLQEREFRPLGGTTTIRADFRLICATNLDPDAAIASGHLREDLYFRLNTMVLTVPPLRERREDIGLLAQQFLTAFATRYSRPARQLDPGALLLLEQHDWRGNVRELEHVMERAVILAQGPAIGVADLPDSVRRPPKLDATSPVMLPGGCTLMELERLAILQTLERTSWNKRATASILGIHRPTLYNKMRKYRLWRPEDRFRRDAPDHQDA